GWSDLGTWDALWEAKERDDQGNALMGDAVQSNCRNSFLVSNGRLVTGVGLENIVVVETADAVLVVKKDHTQEIKKLVVDLGDEGHGL
ncbi:mannose-1-phosphate guanylyltransferase/mannose-6-phosphate isomerase, partial [Klebsiella variicola]|nr:mannose-1-phosphate guanylyltransferase/mannose-6-phosphate isomerase [Klebsiella variicola]